MTQRKGFFNCVRMKRLPAPYKRLLGGVTAASARYDSAKGESMEHKDLTAEQREKARACKTPEEMLALAQEEGYDLTDDELDAVSGGWATCSLCNSLNLNNQIT